MNNKEVKVVEGRAVSGQEGFWIEEQRVVIMVGIGVMGLGEVEGSEVDVIEIRA